MALAREDYDGARRLVAGLLEEAGAATFVFAVEPQGAGWQIRVECEAADGWQTSELTLDHDRLAACDAPGEARREVLAMLRRRLADCVGVGGADA